MTGSLASRLSKLTQPVIWVLESCLPCIPLNLEAATYANT